MISTTNAGTKNHQGWPGRGRPGRVAVRPDGPGAPRSRLGAEVIEVRLMSRRFRCRCSGSATSDSPALGAHRLGQLSELCLGCRSHLLRRHLAAQHVGQVDVEVRVGDSQSLHRADSRRQGVGDGRERVRHRGGDGTSVSSDTVFWSARNFGYSVPSQKDRNCRAADSRLLSPVLNATSAFDWSGMNVPTLPDGAIGKKPIFWLSSSVLADAWSSLKNEFTWTTIAA